MNGPTTLETTRRVRRFWRPGRTAAPPAPVAPPGNVLGGDLGPETLDLIERLVGKGEDVPGLTEHQKAQIHEIAFWRYVAFAGYNGAPPASFPVTQRDWMLANFRRTGWSAWWLRFRSVVEIGCGPLGMIEFLPARRKAAYDPLNRQYDVLFRNVRRSGVRYVSELDPLVSAERGTYDLGICFNVLDHTDEPRALFESYMSLIRPGGRFLFQVNVVKEGEERPEEHARMHPSSFTRDAIGAWLSEYSTRFETHYEDKPTLYNEYFFMAWGRKDRRP